MKRPFTIEISHRDISEDELISDLVRVFRALGGGKLSFRAYNENGKYASSTMAARFGSWNHALEAAGIEANVERDIPEQRLFENLVEVWTKVGRQPRFRDLLPGVSAYSAATYAFRFGSWKAALIEFSKWASDQRLSDENRRDVVKRQRRTSRTVNWRLRAKVLMRDGAKCRLCGAGPEDGAKLQVDHILPWSKGGETEIENLQILCLVCNGGKSDL